MAMNNYSNNIKDLMLLYKDSNEFQMLIDNTIALKYKELWWRSKFDKADLPLSQPADGTAMFKAWEVVEASSPMLNPRAQWAPPKETSKEGAVFYADSIWDWGTSFSLTAQEQAYYDKMLATTNVPLIVLQKFIHTIDQKVKGAHATITNTGAQLLSSGKWMSANKEGFKARGECKEIPAEAFKKAGTKSWADPTADIKGTLEKYVKEMRDAGEERALVLYLSRNEFAYIENNNWFKENLGLIVIGGMVYNPNKIVTVEKYNIYVSEYGGGFLPLIEIQEEKQVLQDNSYTIKSDVTGWKKGMAVLAPAGKQGLIQYADVTELSYLVKGAGERSLAYLEGGLFGILNWTEVGRLDRKITELLASFAPSLSNFKHTYYINTEVAD